MNEWPGKLLGQKSYGSIPHLPGSRIGPGDHHCHEGQMIIATEKCRDRHDRVIVQEKLDGSCMAVAKIANRIYALGRSGYSAQSSQYEQHQLFAHWVRANEPRFADLLNDGERLCGEWLAMAHGTKYRLPHEPFVVFDLMTGHDRIPFDSLRERIAARFVMPRLISDNGPRTIEWVGERLEPSGHGALDPVEGAVWRVERRGAVDFLCKWVRPDKIDGCYLPEKNRQEAIWHWRPRQGSRWKPGI